MQGATGLQIAFLILAVEFFSTLVSRFASQSMGWTRQAFELGGLVTSLAVAAALLLGVPSLRRFTTESLSKTIPRRYSTELIFVALAKAAIPVALLGAYVAWELFAGSPERIAHEVRFDDSVDAWSRTLSPMGLFKLLVVSWFVGPIVEELVFRGLLYRAWERQWGWATSMVLTSACFGLAHPTHMPSAFLGSVVYVCVLRRTGTLRAPILVHMLFNALVSWPVLGHLVFRAPSGDFSTATSWVVPFGCLAFVSVALPAYVWMSRRDNSAIRAGMAPQ